MCIKLKMQWVIQPNVIHRLASGLMYSCPGIVSCVFLLAMEIILQIMTYTVHFLIFPQSPQADITWNQRADLPTTITSQGTAIAVNGIVYYGTEDSIFCYNPTQDDWVQLQETPVTQFGLGHMEGRLVVAGGHPRGALFSLSTNKVYT